MLAHAEQRRSWLARIGAPGGGIDYRASIDQALDEIAIILERHVDIDAIIALSKMAGDQRGE